MTRKLYWEQPDTTFDARILDIRGGAGRTAIVLDQTAFYPTGGGQPCDLGEIDGIAVLDVEIDGGGRILHSLASAPAAGVGELVRCTVDALRRRDHVQHHTGQHILSQAYFRLYGAETRGFRITQTYAEIDLDFDMPVAEAAPMIVEGEELANLIVFENREIRQIVCSADAAARMPLRKETFIEDCVRIVEIADYDLSPCGGTHARHTGEVGMIAIRSFERAKRMIRLRFLCGARLLADYRVANAGLEAISNRFSVGRDQAVDAVARALDEKTVLERRVKRLAEQAAAAEAGDLLRDRQAAGGMTLVTRVFQNRELDEVKAIAHHLVSSGNLVAMLAVTNGATGQMIFASSGGYDAGAVLKSVCLQFGGKGGGTPAFAQGGVPAGSLTAAMNAAEVHFEKARHG